MSASRPRIGSVGRRAAVEATRVGRARVFGRRPRLARAGPGTRQAIPVGVRLAFVRRPRAHVVRPVVRAMTLVIAPRFDVRLAAGSAAGTTGPRRAPTPVRDHRPAVAPRPALGLVTHRLERTVERIVRTATRTELARASGAVRIAPVVPGDRGSRRADPPTLAPVLPRLVHARPALDDVGAAPRADAVPAPRLVPAAALAAAQPDVGHLTEHVLQTLERRIVAERERRGRC